MTMTSLVMRRVSVPLCLALGVGTALPAMAGGLTEFGGGDHPVQFGKGRHAAASCLAEVNGLRP